MKVIYKYPLEIQDIQRVELPENFKILSIQRQNAVPCLWVLVDPEESLMTIDIHLYGTGHPIKFTHLNFIETFQSHGGALVYHAFWSHSIAD